MEIAYTFRNTPEGLEQQRVIWWLLNNLPADSWGFSSRGGRLYKIWFYNEHAYKRWLVEGKGIWYVAG